jgi:hypothetical protein
VKSLIFSIINLYLPARVEEFIENQNSIFIPSTEEMKKIYVWRETFIAAANPIRGS